MKIAITDVETTGLDPCYNEVLEIGCVIIDKDTFEIIETFEVKIKPQFIDRMHPKAQECNGYKEEDWKDAVELKDAMQLYREKTQGAIFCSHNLVFDYVFIMESFKKAELTPGFGLYKLDTVSIAWSKIPHETMTGWSLKKVCERLNIPPEPEIHRGINGAMCCYEIYKKLMKKE